MASIDFYGFYTNSRYKTHLCTKTLQSCVLRCIGNEKVRNFKFLKVDINYQSGSREETCRRIEAENKCHFSLVQLFKSKILS